MHIELPTIKILNLKKNLYKFLSFTNITLQINLNIYLKLEIN